MDLGINKVVKDGNGNTLIYTALIAAMLANAIPTVADGLYFSLQQKWKQQLEDGIITPEQYWSKDIGHYYTITAGYYAIVLLTMLALNKNSFSSNSKILLGILGGGLVISVGMKNVEKDKQILELKKSIKR
jgi:Flp pilus assembly pilin Flp